MDKELKATILTIVSVLTLTFNFFGFMRAVDKANRTGTCEYTRLVNFVNVGYIVGCELFKVRW